MTTLRWFTFAWGCFMAVVMAYFAVQWFAQAENPLRHELGIGFGFGLLYGTPAWLGLPVLAYLERRKLTPAHMTVLLSPLLVATALAVVLGVASSA